MLGGKIYCFIEILNIEITLNIKRYTLSHFDRPSIIREFIQNCTDAIIRINSYDGDLGHLKWEIRDSPELSAKKMFAMGGVKLITELSATSETIRLN